MTTKSLRKLSTQFFKLRQQLEKAKAKDPEITPYFQRVDQLWMDSYRDSEKRERLEAERKDKGEILFEVFQCWPGDHITRTPHRLIRSTPFMQSPSVQLRNGAADRFEKDLAVSLHHAAA